jgi:hypothetical protein
MESLLEWVISATSWHGLPGFFFGFIDSPVTSLFTYLYYSSITSLGRNGITRLLRLTLGSNCVPKLQNGGYIYSSCTHSFLGSIFRVSRISVAIILSFVTHTQFSPHVTSSQESYCLLVIPSTKVAQGYILLQYWELTT